MHVEWPLQFYIMADIGSEERFYLQTCMGKSDSEMSEGKWNLAVMLVQSDCACCKVDVASQTSSPNSSQIV